MSAEVDCLGSLGATRIDIARARSIGWSWPIPTTTGSAYCARDRAASNVAVTIPAVSTFCTEPAFDFGVAAAGRANTAAGTSVRELTVFCD